MEAKNLFSILFLMLLGGCDINLEKQNKESKSIPKIDVGINYEYTQNCVDGERDFLGPTKCITASEYQELCTSASGITKWGARGTALFDGLGRYLVDNGDTESVTTRWLGNGVCRVYVTVSGMHNGSSVRRELDSNVKSYLLGNNGKILVHDTSKPF